MIVSCLTLENAITLLYSDVTVMVPAMVSVDEGGGMVQVCAELNAMEATQREFNVTLASSDDSGMNIL